MKWLQLYLIIGLLVSSDWKSHIDHVCPSMDARAIYTVGAMIWPILLFAETFNTEPPCKNKGLK